MRSVFMLPNSNSAKHLNAFATNFFEESCFYYFNVLMHGSTVYRRMYYQQYAV